MTHSGEAFILGLQKSDILFLTVTKIITVGVAIGGGKYPSGKLWHLLKKVAVVHLIKEMEWLWQTTIIMIASGWRGLRDGMCSVSIPLILYNHLMIDIFTMKHTLLGFNVFNV